jgi:phosphate transport system substrate-binding protein
MTPTASGISIKLGALALSLCLASVGCKKKSEQSAGGEQATGQAETKQLSIQDIGSDTMVNLAQAWAEAYAKVEPTLSIEVSGGGSGVGAAALINGTADIANCSRSLKPEEIQKAKASGKNPKQFVVGYDGLAVYVYKDNPLDQISVGELSEIYREGGKFDKWSQVGVTNIPGAKSDEIIRVSRQNNSGTYQYFREHVLGKNADYKSGSLDMNGSKEVIELIAKTPGAIGYSGLGYATPAVKILKISKEKGGTAIMPSIATVHDKSYPIARPMFMYTPGEPTPQIKKYLDWIMSPAGQKLVEETGYVPLAK